MKLSSSIILASIAGTTSAFVAPSNQHARSTFLRMVSDDPTPLTSAEEPLPTESSTASYFVPEPVAPQPKMSQALPFMERPAALDGSMVGDVGFDPFGFSKTQQDLLNYREAEIKHGRLAMLAAAGWPLSELFDKKIADGLGLVAVVDSADRAPSILNGGLEKVSPIYWVACLALAGAIDLYGISRSKSNDPAYFPGNLGFDPLGLYPKDTAGQERMQLAELKNGRLGMIAITAFAVQELVTKMGVIDQTPLFFKPIMGVMHEYANSGYYIPN
jgi:Chlorophyll A-B binding protein